MRLGSFPTRSEPSVAPLRMTPIGAIGVENVILEDYGSALGQKKEKREQAPALQMEFSTGLIIPRDREESRKTCQSFWAGVCLPALVDAGVQAVAGHLRQLDAR